MTRSNRKIARGGGQLQTELTSVIHEAVLGELAENGYGRLSMDAVARRAGAGKAALYRRWPSKQEMVIAVVGEFSVPMVDVRDTGSIEGDTAQVLHAVQRWVTHPWISAALPQLIAEGARDARFAAAVNHAVGEPRRALTAGLIDRAVARGELRPEVDREIAIDLLAAPLYWRHGVRFAAAGPEYLERLTAATVAALKAL